MENSVIEISKKLVSLPTYKGNISEEMTSEIENILKNNNYDFQKIMIDGIYHYLALIKNKGKHISFIGHYDVVPEGDGWDSDPYTPFEREGIIYGRGICDMKGGLAAQICAGRKLAEKGFQVSIFIVGDEESDSKAMPELIKLLDREIDFCIGGEPTSNSITGDTIKIGRRGVITGDVTIKGIQGHSAYPEKADNPIHKFLDIGKEFIKKIDDGDGFLPETSIQITSIESGSEAYNVIPGELKFKFDIRNSSETSIPEVEEILRKRLDKLGFNYVLEIKSRSECFLVKDPKFTDLVLKSIEEVIKVKPKISYKGGTSDCRFIARHDSKIPIVEVGLPSSNIHGVNEFASIKNIELLEKIYLKIGENLLSLV